MRDNLQLFIADIKAQCSYQAKHTERIYSMINKLIHNPKQARQFMDGGQFQNAHFKFIQATRGQIHMACRTHNGHLLSLSSSRHGVRSAATEVAGNAVHALGWQVRATMPRALPAALHDRLIRVPDYAGIGDLDIQHGFQQLPNEKPKTFQAFVTWMYVAFLHVSRLSSPLYLPVELDLLFELYVFAYAHHINDLQDVIISVLYKKFAKDSNTAPRETR